MFRAVIMGLPGSGKGTLSHRIIKDFNIYHIASGDLLRAHIENKTDVGTTAKRYIDAGQLVPDDLMVELVSQELDDVRHHSWLLDGFPRTRVQAEKLQKIQTVDVVLNLEIPIPVIVDRIAGRMIHVASGRVYNKNFNPPRVPGLDDITGEPLIVREDDQSEMVTKRLESFHELTSHVIEYYRQLGILTDFRGETTDALWPKLYQYLSRRIEPMHFTSYS